MRLVVAERIVGLGDGEATERRPPSGHEGVAPDRAAADVDFDGAGVVPDVPDAGPERGLERHLLPPDLPALDHPLADDMLCIAT